METMKSQTDCQRLLSDFPFRKCIKFFFIYLYDIIWDFNYPTLKCNIITNKFWGHTSVCTELLYTNSLQSSDLHLILSLIFFSLSILGGRISPLSPKQFLDFLIQSSIMCIISTMIIELCKFYAIKKSFIMISSETIKDILKFYL